MQRTAFGLLLLGLLWVLVLPAAQANEALRLGEDIPYGLLMDPGGELGIDEVAALPQEAFAHRQRSLSEGYSRDIFWLRFHLPAELFAEGERWLEVFPPYLDYVTLYHRPVGSEQPWQVLVMGDRLPAAMRPIDYRLFVFPLQHHGTEALEVVLRLQTTSSALLEARLWSPQAFASSAFKSTAYWGGYFGLAALSTLFAVALTVVMRSRTMLAVSLFSLSYLLVAGVQGMLGWIALRHFPLLSDQFTSYSVFFTHALILLVIREALHLYRHFPHLDRLVLAVMGVMVLASISIPLQHYGQAVTLVYALFELIKYPLLVAGVLLWRRHGHGYGLVVIGYFLLTTASTLSALTVQGLIPLLPGVYLLWQYMLLVLMLLITAITIHRVWLENREKRSREALELALRQEQEASTRQRQFMGMVSHELRTPLAVIAASATNLASALPADQEAWHRRVQKIRRAGQRLSQLTDNFLADARLDTQLNLADVVSTDLARLTREVMDNTLLSEQHPLLLRVDGQPCAEGSCPVCPMAADEALLRIAISNVLDNAIKYSPPGTITLAIDPLPGAWRLAITNQGPVIPDELQEKIFMPYVKGAREHGMAASYGSGLGLHVARLIARRHGGDLVLQSSTPQGTVFVFTLPREIAHKQP